MNFQRLLDASTYKEAYRRDMIDLRAKMGSVQTQRADRKDETSCQETWAGARLACGHQ